MVSEQSSVVSDGDMALFMAGVNPEKTHVRTARGALRARAEEAPASEPDVEEEEQEEEEEENDDGGYGGAAEYEEEEEECVEEEEASELYRSEASASTSRRREGPRSSTGTFSKFVSAGASAAGQRAERDEMEEMLEKQSTLLDMERLKMQGIRLTKEWTMDDDLDDMQFEMKRLMLHVDETNSIGMMRNTLQLACTGIEMLNRRFGLLQLDGWSEEACRDMHKYDRALGRIYRKYWRKAHNNSPEMEIAMGLLGSAGMYHARRAFSEHVLKPSIRPTARRSTARPTDSDDEGMPP